jgi:tripartite-type tricarboxylate transporter receptor subunit TctC
VISRFKRFRAGVFVLCCLPLWLSANASDKYPEKPVRVVVPFPAGGGTDTMARTIGLALQQALGQPFLVDNKTGATGNIGTEFVARSPGDGYTLLVVPNSLAINKFLFPRLSFDPQKSFKPVALLGSSPVVVGVKASLPVNSIQELIAMARKNPGKLSYASCGSGSPQHIAGELFKMMAKVDIAHIPYKGCSPAAVDAAGGLVDVVFNTVANIRPFVQSGKVRALAVTSAKRSALAPELPTVQESNLPGYDIEVWFGALAPAGTPDAVIARLNAEITKTLARPEVRDGMEKISYEAVGGSSKQFADVIQRDLERYGAIISKANIRLD